MKVAILSDVHANSEALSAVLRDIDNQGITKILIAGDLIGYYYQPKNVLEILKDRDVIVCKGNHENLFEKWCSVSEAEQQQLKKKYGSGFKIAQYELTIDQKEWLFSLRHPVFEVIDGKHFCMAHGSPWNIDQYIYFDQIAQAEDKFGQLSEALDVVILGHTHYPGIKKIGQLMVINPGSVGQPRSGHLDDRQIGATVRAHWAIIETRDLTVSFKTTLYDASLLFQEIDAHDADNPYLKNVLCRTE